MVELVDPERKISNIEWTEFAKSFPVALPESFKAHYLRINGGYLAEEDVEADRWGMPVGGFNPIKYGALPIETLINDIFSISPAESEYGPWHEKEFIPFAYDNGGNPFFLSLKATDYGHIYLYAQDGDALFEVAESFDDFIKALYRL
ncbi:SMI1/KNR4 family protein [Cronobacter malonaticus]|uniref:SMI1/KNR4 family protein n=1 Tax=Cronobacter malonaticus TaxID=413503 RepID=UPI0028958BBC|nr:SMI1/KNR4 family protein [Cronobacter malonaticus]ELY5938609.1 SMI1/KNR4 family protein [Cronobacter malonaticus]ELY6202931.1 SMI1/KNR4 family protein [Cronobacter malonaticus]ELY6257511.1 SMI1/KNR4 family protein [Cronobacter malonaticus]MDT3561444.1 SMI1/KNR4 family protein [Cronobacter malonaticus]